MDIDLFKVVLIFLAVLPGYLARRGSDRVIPRTQRRMGATEEIAEFLIFSVAAHFTLAIFYSCFWTLAGLWCKGSAWYFIADWSPLTPSGLLVKLGEVPAVYLAIYLLLSLFVGWFMGLGRGLLDAWRADELVARKLGFENSRPRRFWSKNIERFLITGRPIIYNALFPDLDDEGYPKDVFVEIVLKDNQGSITGRVTSFSIANDEENHKLLYLKGVYRKLPDRSQYEKLDADGMLVDIADAVTLQIKQV
jgi:hypothetical protein